MTTYSASYSAQDNKLRLYASSRLDSETYAAVRAAGFIWAPKQELFVAPMWTPSREDFLYTLVDTIEDEDSTAEQRAAQRAERFEDYSEKRAVESERAADYVASIADNIPLGQPILVGHHSEKHARRDADKIKRGLDKAVRLWDTAKYWESRAQSCLAHADYKEQPGVRARRIKGIEADRRKAEKTLKFAETFLKLYTNVETLVSGKDPEAFRVEHGRDYGFRDKVLYVVEREVYTSAAFTLAKFPRLPRPDGKPDYNYEGNISYADAIREYVVTAEWVHTSRIGAHTRKIAHYQRWIAHYDNRLTYEKAMLAAQGASAMLDKKPRPTQLPLLNYRAAGGSITTRNMYHRNETICYPQVDMTSAEYAAINKDYKGTRHDINNTHRFRTAMQKSTLVAVFLTDSKVHDVPAPLALAAE